MLYNNEILYTYGFEFFTHFIATVRNI